MQRYDRKARLVVIIGLFVSASAMADMPRDAFLACARVMPSQAGVFAKAAARSTDSGSIALPQNSISRKIFCETALTEASRAGASDAALLKPGRVGPVTFGNKP